MPALAADGVPANDEQPAPSVAVLAGHLFLSCLGISMLLQARPQLVLNLTGGSASTAGSKLARWTALAAAAEFLASVCLLARAPAGLSQSSVACILLLR